MYSPNNIEPKNIKGSNNDFILLSEFSELEGPVPLEVIPEGYAHGFDLNSFVLRIMAVDYQNKAVDLASASEDTQVVVSDVKDQVYAYVCNSNTFLFNNM